MRCLAVDDEPPALSIIRNFCSKIPFITSFDTCADGMEAMEYLKMHHVDLMFLDINMPHITGIELARIIDNPPMIIFTTAYQNHALAGFELSAVDYLVKPFSFERFLKGVNRAHEQHLLRESSLPEGVRTLSQTFTVKVDYSMVRLNSDDILFFEGLKDYVKISCVSKNYVTKSTMKNLEEHLSADIFMRVHRSYIVNLGKIERFEDNQITLCSCDTRIPLGQQYRDSFIRFMEDTKL